MAHVFVIGAAVGTIVGAPPRPPQRFPLRNIFTPLPSPPRSRALEARASPRPGHGCARDVPPTSRARRYVYRLHRTRPLASPSLPLAPVADRSPRSPSLRSQIKQKANAKRPDDDGFYDAETPEEFAKRKADAQSRIAGIEAMLKEQAAQLEAFKAEAEASVGAAPPGDERRTSRAELARGDGTQEGGGRVRVRAHAGRE